MDAREGLRAASILQQRKESHQAIQVLLESPVLYESVRPFLQVLQSADPLKVPMARYITHGNLGEAEIALPEYANLPGFMWDLSTLLRDEEDRNQCFMEPHSDVSIASAREILYERGKLDKRRVSRKVAPNSLD